MAVVGNVATGEEPHQGSLACAVRPDQADALARADLETHALEDRVARILAAEVRGGDQDHGETDRGTGQKLGSFQDSGGPSVRRGQSRTGRVAAGLAETT